MRPFAWGRTRKARIDLVTELARVWGREGDRIVATVAAILNTPFPDCRLTPIGLLLRMHVQARQIAKQRRG